MRHGRFLMTLPVLFVAWLVVSYVTSDRYSSHAWSQNVCMACGVADDDTAADSECTRVSCTCGLDRSDSRYTDPADCNVHGSTFQN